MSFNTSPLSTVGRIRPHTASPGITTKSTTASTPAPSSIPPHHRSSNSLRVSLNELLTSETHRQGVLSRLNKVVSTFTLKEFREELRQECEEESARLHSDTLAPCEVRLNHFKKEMQSFLTKENSAMSSLVTAMTSEYESVIRHLKTQCSSESTTTLRTTLLHVQTELNDSHKQCVELKQKLAQQESVTEKVKAMCDEYHDNLLKTQKELDELRLCVGNEAAKVIPNADVYDLRTFTKSVYALVTEVQEIRNRNLVLTNENTKLVEEYNQQCDELSTALDRANDVQSQNAALKATIRLMKAKIESLEHGQVELQSMTRHRDLLEFELSLAKCEAEYQIKIADHAHSLLNAVLTRKAIPSELGNEVKAQTAIVGLGTETTTPPWLRGKGKIKNLMYDMKTTLTLFQEITTEKIATETAQETEISLLEFLPHYFTKKYGRPALVLEATYSLVDACSRFRATRSECDLLGDILKGTCPGPVYDAGAEKVAEVRAACQRIETEKTGGAKKKAAVKIPRVDIVSAIQKVFPHVAATSPFWDRVNVALFLASDPKSSEEILWEQAFDLEVGRLGAVLRYQVYLDYLQYGLQFQNFALQFSKDNDVSAASVPVSVLHMCLQEFEGPKCPKAEITRRVNAGMSSAYDDPTASPQGTAEGGGGDPNESSVRSTSMANSSILDDGRSALHISWPMFCQNLKNKCYFHKMGA